MTGFASQTGEFDAWTWAWDMRSVNARGLDLRLRLPDWLDGLEQGVRAAVSKVAARGSVTLALRLARADTSDAAAVNEVALTAVLHQMAKVQSTARELGLTLAAPSPADILAMRGVLGTAGTDDDPKPLVSALMADLPALLTGFDAMRVAEGAALGDVLAGQLDRIADLTNQAAILAEARKDQWAERLEANLARAMQHADGADPDKLAQELAVIVVKADVTEEIDRLRAHVAAARDLLASEGPVGRKLDFLSQEFNREANTLCAKAQSNDLTAVGLDLKATIDQMREQIQNVE